MQSPSDPHPEPQYLPNAVPPSQSICLLLWAARPPETSGKEPAPSPCLLPSVGASRRSRKRLPTKCAWLRKDKNWRERGLDEGQDAAGPNQLSRVRSTATGSGRNSRMKRPIAASKGLSLAIWPPSDCVKLALRRQETMESRLAPRLSPYFPHRSNPLRS